jgi:hypothetical protein
MSGRGKTSSQMQHVAVGMGAEGNDGVCTGTELATVQGQGTPTTAESLVTCQEHSDFSSLAAQAAPHCLQER